MEKSPWILHGSYKMNLTRVTQLTHQSNSFRFTYFPNHLMQLRFLQQLTGTAEENF